MKPHIVIIGAGITGLALGWFLKQRHGNDVELTILEKSHRPGGWIRSEETDGFFFEQGPRSCRTRGKGKSTLKLIEALGLQDQVIIPSEAAHQRYLYLDDRLQRLPRSLFSFLYSPLMKGVLPALWKEWRVSPSCSDDETIYEFISRRLTPGLAERLVDPLVSGIYAGDMRQLSMRACFPDIWALEKEYGSLVAGMLKKTKEKDSKESSFVQSMQRVPFFSFKQGMETLVKALASALQQELHLGQEVTHLNPEGDGVTIALDNQSIRADRVFLAVPSDVAAMLCRPWASEVSQQMQKNSCASVAVVNMGWKQSQLKYKGFGYLIPSSEQENLLGCVWDSSAFPQHNSSDGETRLTAMLGGMHRPEICLWPQEKIIDVTRQSLKRHLGIERICDAVRVTIAKQAIPQYGLGHQNRVAEIERQLQQLSNNRILLLGNAWHGVAVNDCIATAEKYA